MRLPPVRFWFASAAFSIGAVDGACASLAAVSPPAHVHVVGWVDVVLIFGAGLGTGLLGWWLVRRQRRAIEEQAPRRIRQMSRLIEHADCMLWEAEVELWPDTWRWQMTFHPSVFARKLFRGELPRPDADMWINFRVDQRAEMDQRARAAMEGGETGYRQEFRVARGEQAYWLREDVSITPLSGNRYWLVGLITDVTAQREAEAAQRQSEQNVDRILAHAQCLLWQAKVVLEHGKLAWLHFDIPHSQFSELLLGTRVFSRERGFWEGLTLPEHSEMDERSTQAILGGAAGYSQQFRVINREGQLFWVNERVSISSAGPNEWTLVGAITDVTAQRVAEDAWRASQARLGKLLELADCMVWEATVKLRENDTLQWDFYTQRSVLFRRIFGDAVATMDWTQLPVPELPEMDRRALWAVKGEANGYTQEFHVEKPEGAIWLREVVTVAKQSNGTFRFVGVITDITAQRRAEEAQRRSELRLTALLDRADYMIWQGEARQVAEDEFDWNIFTPNSQLYRRIFQRDPGPRCYFSWDNGSVPEYPQMRARAHRAMLTGAPGYEQTFRYEAPSGTLWLQEKVTLKRLAPDRWELVGIITDITAQHVSEIARQASDARLHEVLTRADCLLWEAEATLLPNNWTWEFHIHPSGLCQTLYGVPQPTPDQGLWRSFEIPERVAMNERCQAAMREQRPGYEQVFHIVRPDGGVIWISESVTIRRVGENRFSLVGVAVDITPQRGAEEALAAEKERLSVTLRAMHEAVITTDVAGVVQFMNPAAAALTGWSESEACGRSVGEVLKLENNRSAQPIEVPVRRVARGDVVADLPPQTRLVARDHQRRVIEGCCAPIHAVDSKVIGAVLVFRDVTEQDRLEQELVRATRLESVGVLAGGIAHDFNNILTAVMGNLTLAQLDVEPGTSVAASLRSAEKAALRARDLTQQLLTFAKGGEPVRAAVQLEAIVREMTSFALHGSQVKAHFDLAPDLWPADADKGQIGRVVQNVVINAVQAMPGGGTLRIAARNDMLDGLSLPGLAPGSYIQIAISDTGEGIRPENLARIFDPYFTTKQTGTGLGLAAVYSIVKKHRGHVDVESQVGQGTTFRIWLPALREQVAAVESRAPWSPGRMNGRVLFMDDEQIIRDMATTLLRRFGLSVDCAVDGAEAVEKYRSTLDAGQAYDLVVMDLTVPGGMGGLAAVRELRQLDPKVKAIVSSGYSSDPVLANYRDHGFVAMVAKPYEVNEFARVLREVLPA